MLQTQTANLSQDEQKRLHPEFLADEVAYLKMRDSLLGPYQGQWVAVRHGSVIAAGPNLMVVMEKASTAGGHPYIALVGDEEAAMFRVRRGMFTWLGYSTAFWGRERRPFDPRQQ